MTASHTPVQWNRLIWAIGLSLGATIILTPAAEWILGTHPRKTGKLILHLTFLGTLLVTGRRAGVTLSEDTGLTARGGPRLWSIGFLSGSLSLALFMASLTLIDERFLGGYKGPLHLALYALKYLPLSFIIGILEDVTFFGLLYNVLGKRSLWPVGIYSVTHFIQGDRSDFEGPVALHGVEVLSRMGGSLANLLHQPMEFVGLCLIGAVLLSVRRETGSIWCSMGIHGGWYFSRMLGRKFNKDQIGDHEWFYGSNRFCDGVLGWIVILGAGWIVHLWWTRRIARVDLRKRTG